MRRRGRSGLLLCALGALLLLPSPPAAAAPASVFAEDLTWTELRDLVAAGRTTVLIPIGGTEQNGPHLALGKHNVRARLLAGRIAAGLGNALVAPVLAYVPEGRLDPPSGHMRYPGTVTVPPEAFETILEYAARSFKAHGFRDIVFLGDHGSYQQSEAAVARRLDREWAAGPVRVHALPEYYQASTAGFARLLESRGYAAHEIGKHAGLADTSLMLALDPSLVRGERLRPGDGTDGDPTRSTAVLGALGVDLIVTTTIAAIKTATARRQGGSAR